MSRTLSIDKEVFLMLRTKRIYQESSKEDGYRILVDRLWPRGVSKGKANIDYWAKEIAPSIDLRKDFNHEPEKFEEFKQAYLFELSSNDKSKEFLELINSKHERGNVTLLYAARDESINHAVVLKDWVEGNL